MAEEQKQSAAEAHRAELEPFSKGEATAAQLAEKLGVSAVTVYRWLSDLGWHKSKKRGKRRAKVVKNGNGATALEPLSASDKPSITRGLVTLTVEGALVGVERDIALACCNLANKMIARQRTAVVARTHFSSVDPREHVNMRLDQHFSRVLGGDRDGVDELISDLLLKVIFDAKSAS